MTQPHTKHAYFLAPKIDKPKISNFPIRLIPIETDGSFFFEQLRLHLDDTGVIVPETAFEACRDILPSVIDAHDSSADAFLKTHHPLLIFTMSYQDGLIHGLKRIEKLRMTGYYHDPHRVTHLIGGYVNRSKEFRRRRDFWNSSYGDGYCDALLYLISRHSGAGLACPPMYGFHGSKDFYSLSSLLRFPKRNVMPTYSRHTEGKPTAFLRPCLVINIRTSRSTHLICSSPLEASSARNGAHPAPRPLASGLNVIL
jgi:hypothetical protein